MKDVKYERIFAALQQELNEGRYDGQNPFPSEAQLVRRFGVSRFTVVEAIKKLEKARLVVRRRGRGTFPTRFARTSSGPIGLIMPGLAYGEIYAPICSEITRLCQRRGRMVLLGNTTAEAPAARADAAKRLAADFVRQRVAGVIMHPIEYLKDSAGVNREIASTFAAADVPVVLLDYDVEPPPRRSRLDLVGIDNFAAGRRLGEHLVSVGARRVLFVKRRNCAATVESRLLGLAAAMTAAGCLWSADSVLEAEPTATAPIARLLRGAEMPDAIVCGYDVHAAGVLKAIEKTLGPGAVPSRIRLAGFDDVRCASVMTPALTTLHQPCKELARLAVETLHRRMEFPDSPVCTLLLDAPLVVRESTRA